MRAVVRKRIGLSALFASAGLAAALGVAEPKPLAAAEPADVRCAKIGDKCPDGTIYAGHATDGRGKWFSLYTTPADAPGLFRWSGGEIDADAVTGVDNPRDGLLNTRKLHGRLTIGFVHEAANYCMNLATQGYNDWYLPSEAELQRLYINRSSIGNLYTGDWPQIYWSSTESSGSGIFAFGLNFLTGTALGYPKSIAARVRCVRRGIPRPLN